MLSLSSFVCGLAILHNATLQYRTQKHKDLIRQHNDCGVGSEESLCSIVLSKGTTHVLFTRGWMSSSAN